MHRRFFLPDLSALSPRRSPPRRKRERRSLKKLPRGSHRGYASVAHVSGPSDQPLASG